MINKNNWLKVVCIIGWPFLLVVAVYLWKGDSSKQREAEERKSLLSDTAKVNKAYLTYERVHRQLLEEEPEVQELAEGVLELKGRLNNIRQYAEEADGLLEELDYQGYDVDDVKSLLENIIEECERRND